MTGLLRDDTLHENDDVKEALKRIPDKMYDERMYRISRALNLSNQKTVLPKDEWTTLEQVIKYLYIIDKQYKDDKKSIIIHKLVNYINVNNFMFKMIYV